MLQKHSVRVEFKGQRTCMLSSSWSPHSTRIGSNEIKILRLHSEECQQFHYVSIHNSGISPKENKFLQIDGNFGRSLGLSNSEEILVSEITQVPITTKTAMVSCACQDDWEILETNAEIVTNSLLNQLRIVYAGLKFPFWVTKSMTINLKIDKIEPEAEFGILDSTSEIIIPSISSVSKPAISISGFPKVRLHPIVLFQSEFNYIVPSVSLLLNNTRHAFAYKTAFSDQNFPDCDNENEQTPNTYLFAKFFEPKSKNNTNSKNQKKLSPIVVKVYLLDHLDINANVIKKSFPLTNPLALFVHPKLLESFQERFSVKSLVSIEQSSEREFDQEESIYKSIELRNDCLKKTMYAGFENLIREGTDFLRAALSLNKARHGLVGPTAGSLLITGREGSGKSALTGRLTQEFADHPFFVHSEIIFCPKLRGKKSESIEKHLMGVLENAAKFQPSLVVLDDLDVLIPSPRAEQQNLAEEFQSLRVSETLIDCFKQFEGQQIVLMATSKGTDTLNSYWKSRQGFHFFQKCVHIPPPTQLERQEIFELHLNSYLDLPEVPTSVIHSSNPDNETSTITNPQSFVLSDSMKISLISIHDEFATPQMISRVAEKWALHLFELGDHNRSRKSNTKDDINFRRIIDEEIRNFGGNGGGEDSKEKITWKQIGGLKDVKQELTKILEWPIKYPKLFENSPVKLPSGILLYGFPGSGKTLLAVAVPSIVNAKFIHIKGPELLSKYIGASEQSVKDLFQRAKDSKPCILFFDEFDSLVPRRGHDSTGVTDRVVNQFLAEMDGVDGGMGQGVHLIAATSRPDLIDPAILRPGRLDKHLFFPMPCQEERVEILKRQSEQLNLSSWVDEDWDLIGHETEGFTGADLHSLLFSAQMASIQEYLGKVNTNTNESTLGPNTNREGNRNENLHLKSEGKTSQEDIVVTMDHMRNALASFQPSLKGKELKKFQAIYKNFSSSRDGSERNSDGSGESSLILPMSEKRATLA